MLTFVKENKEYMSVELSYKHLARSTMLMRIYERCASDDDEVIITQKNFPLIIDFDTIRACVLTDDAYTCETPLAHEYVKFFDIVYIQ